MLEPGKLGEALVITIMIIAMATLLVGLALGALLF